MEGLEAKYVSSRPEEPQTPNQHHATTGSPKKQKRRNERIQIDFDLSTFDLDQLYEHFLAFKNLLADTLGIEEGERIGFEDVVQATMQRLGEYTSEELVGLALYHFDLLLIHLRDLGQASLRTVVKNLLLLLGHALDSRNGQASFVCLEVIEFLGEAVEPDLIVQELTPLFDQLDSPDLITKLAWCLLCLKEPGHRALQSMLDEGKAEKSRGLMQACLHHPGILRCAVIPMLLEDAASKTLSSSKRAQAALLLSKTGGLLEKPQWVALFAAAIRHGTMDPDLAAQCLVSAGKLGSKEYVGLLKSDNLSDKARAALCKTLRSYRREPAQPTLQVCIAQEPLRDASGSRWSLASAGQKPEEGGSLSEGEHVSLQLSVDEAESLLRRFLMTPGASAQKSSFFFEARPMYLSCYTALLRGSMPRKEKRVPKSIVGLLLDNLDHADPAVREAALSSLGLVGVEWSQLVLPRVEQ